MIIYNVSVYILLPLVPRHYFGQLKKYKTKDKPKIRTLRILANSYKSKVSYRNQSGIDGQPRSVQKDSLSGLPSKCLQGGSSYGRVSGSDVTALGLLMWLGCNTLPVKPLAILVGDRS